MNVHQHSGRVVNINDEINVLFENVIHLVLHCWFV